MCLYIIIIINLRIQRTFLNANLGFFLPCAFFFRFPVLMNPCQITKQARFTAVQTDHPMKLLSDMPRHIHSVVTRMA